MPTLIRSLSSAVCLVALALPAFAQTTVTHAPADDRRAEANVFMTAKVIAIQPERDRIQIRDNDGIKRTLVLDDDATLPEGRLRSGTDVILSVREDGGRRRVVSVQRSEPAARRPISRAEPVFIPAPGTGGLRGLAAAQASYQSGVVGVPMAGEPARAAAPLWGTPMAALGTPVADAAAQPILGGVTGTPLTDARGQAFVDASGRPLLAVRGTMFTDQVGRPIADGAGRPLIVDPSSARDTLNNIGGGLRPLNGTFLTDATGRPLLDASGRAVVSNNGRSFSDSTGRTFIDATGRPVQTAGAGNLAPVAPTAGGNAGAVRTTTPLGSGAGGGALAPRVDPAFVSPTGFTLATPTGATAPGAVAGTTLRSGADFTPPNLIVPSANVSTLTTPVPGTSIGPVISPGGGAGTTNPAPVRTFTNADLARVGGGASLPTSAAPVSLGVGGSGIAVRTAPDGESVSVPNAGPPQAAPELGGLGIDAAPLPVGHAVQAFEGSMARLAMQVTAVDAAFARYREMCMGPRAAESAGHSWLGFWNGATTPVESRDECEPILAQALRLGEQVQRGMRTAEDGARRSGVLPGVRRQIRAQYGMDWMGWDQ